MVRLAAVKAVANRIDAASYPLPADACLERTFATRLATRPAASQQRAIATVTTMLALTGSDRRAMFGDLAGIDLTRATPVATLASSAAIPLAITSADLASLAAFVKSSAATTARSSTATATKLSLRLRRVVCDDETDPEWLGDDEIAIGGVSVDEDGDTKKIDAFTVRDDFDTGEHKKYDPPQTFCTFSITEGGDGWPKSYSVAMFLAEKDGGGFATFLSEAVSYVKPYATSLAINSGDVIAILAAYLLMALVQWLTELWEDDVFPAIVDSVDISSQTHVFSNGTRTSDRQKASTSGYGGTYTLHWDWQLT